MLLLLVTLSCSSTSTNADDPAATTAVAPAPAAPLLPIPPDQAAVIAHAETGLDLLCTKSARARELQKFLKENGVEAIMIPDGIQIVSAPSVPHPFLVIGNPLALHGTTGELVNGAHFEVHDSVPILELRGTESSTMEAGLKLAHEIVHAEENALHNEPPSVYPEPNWLIGESIAHRTVFRVLDEYTQGKWSVIINERSALMNEFLVSQGKDPDLGVFGFRRDDAQVIKILFPGIDATTIGALLAQMDVDTNLVRIDQMSAREHLDADTHRTEVITRMKDFYEQMGYQPNQ